MRLNRQIWFEPASLCDGIGAAAAGASQPGFELMYQHWPRPGSGKGDLGVPEPIVSPRNLRYMRDFAVAYGEVRQVCNNLLWTESCRQGPRLPTVVGRHHRAQHPPRHRRLAVGPARHKWRYGDRSPGRIFLGGALVLILAADRQSLGAGATSPAARRGAESLASWVCHRIDLNALASQPRSPAPAFRRKIVGLCSAHCGLIP
ncbi:hypothetical protein ACVIW0_001459 [Bradyrhizobium sp. USDA 4454]